MKKILIIEDEEILLDLLKRKITDEGFEVLTAKDGEEGLKLARLSKPDLILLDPVVPKKSGFEIMEELKKDNNSPPASIIIISNSGQPVELEKAKELGAKDWLVKTQFDLCELLEKINKHI